MRTSVKQLLSILALSVLSTVCAPAASLFLQWDTISGDPIEWSSGPAGYTATIPVKVTLYASGISNPSLIPYAYNGMPVGTAFQADLTYTWAAPGAATNPFATLYFQDADGSVSLVDSDRGAASTDELILSAVFQNAYMQFDPTSNAVSITLDGNSSGTSYGGGTESLTYSSDILSFAGLTSAGMTIGSPDGGPFTLDGSELGGWSGGADGTFSATPGTQAQSPEPGTFVLFGSALVAAGLLGRKRLLSHIA